DDCEHVPRVRISDGEWLAARTVTSSPPALKVDRPHVVRCCRLHCRRAFDDTQRSLLPPAAYLSKTEKQSMDGSLARRQLSRRRPETAGQLASAPTRMLLACSENGGDHVLGCGQRRRARPATQLLEACVPRLFEALDVLVAGLPRDLVLATQRRN